MSGHYGVLLETGSIQNYIFQSNKLKTNLGASYLIRNKVFGKVLKDAAEAVFNSGRDMESWKQDPDKTQIGKLAFETGYIGGGNALLLFQDKKSAEKLVREWSKRLLIEMPGVKTAAAIGPWTGKFRHDLDELSVRLRTNKAECIPQTVIPRHGITAGCRQSGLSAEIKSTEKDNIQYVSSMIHAKIKAAAISRKDFQDKFKKYLSKDDEKYCFPDMLENLGSISGEDSHIAIVHIDGNRMADRFKAARSLAEIRKLSVSAHKAIIDAFGELTGHIVNHYEKIMRGLGFDNTIKDEKYWFPMDKDLKMRLLPIAPIVLGGDDITFVCDGKLGIYFAGKFIEFFEEKKVSDNHKLTACAGIAIVKVKYPFYRGYKMAEELCSNAKKLNDGENKPENLISGLDFHISMAGISDTVKATREKQFTTPQGSLIYRPYPLYATERIDTEPLDEILKAARKLKNYPNNKLKELRTTLFLSGDACKNFVKEAKFRQRPLPELPGRDYHIKLFDNSRTPYFDMIELLEFYPEFAMAEKGGPS